MTRSEKITLWVTVFALLVLLGIVAGAGFYKANAIADSSAHAALTAEICDHLRAIPRGERFPNSLKELPLRYPDGGSPALLTRFVYSSTGTSCIVRTSLRGQEFSRTYP